MEERNNGKFLPGNPGGPGRPRKKPSTKELLKTLTQEAILYLSDLMHSDDKETAIKACLEIIKFSLSEENKSKEELATENNPIAEFMRNIATLPPTNTPAPRITCLGETFDNSRL